MRSALMTPAARELLTRIDELHPLDRDSLFNALAGWLLGRLAGADLWAELRELDFDGECKLGDYIVRWLTDEGEACDADEVLAAIHQRRAAKESNHAAH